MRNAITVSALAAWFALAAAAPGFAAFEFYVVVEGATQGSLQGGTAPETPKLAPGRADLRADLEAPSAGAWQATLSQNGKVVYPDLRFSIEGCDGERPTDWSGGRARIREATGGSARLRVRHPRRTRCFLVATLPRSRDAQPADGMAAPVSPPTSGKHQPGFPDQGLHARGPLPDLEIRRVDPVPGTASKLEAIVRNRGLGASEATQLKLYRPTDGGPVLTAHVPVPGLAAGQTAAVQIGIAGQVIDQARLRVDDPNQIVEVDELNNEFQYTAPK